MTGNPYGDLITVGDGNPVVEVYTHPDLISTNRHISFSDEPCGALEQLSQVIASPIPYPADYVPAPHREHRPINRVRNLIRQMNRLKV
jgi:hypothetical protein